MHQVFTDRHTKSIPRDHALLGNDFAASSSKVALVHEWFKEIAGSEKVLLAFHDIFPDAPIYTAMANLDLVSRCLGDVRINTSFLQRWPLVSKYHQKFLPLYMCAFEQFDLSEFDLVISSSHCSAKAIITKPQTCHICYCHSPMRYAWDMQHSYAKFQSKLVRALWTLAANYVRVWDYATASRVDYFVANSGYVARRIRKFYGKPAAVIYPPVDVERFAVSPSTDDYYLVVSRFAPYKRVDLIVQAFNRLGWRLVVIGNGEQEAYLKRIAGRNIEFRGHLPDNAVAEYFQRCKASIIAAEEDFGINMVECLASGRPVVAYGAGGALEIVEPGVNGVLYRELSEVSLVQALRECQAHRWEPDSIRESSLRFSADRFKKEFARFVEWALVDFEGDSAGKLPILHRTLESETSEVPWR